MATETIRKEYISAAETAKLIRQALKRAFPGVKFSVRTRHGSVVDVKYRGDTPTRQEVEKVARAYEGQEFDGMIDLAASKVHWLMPDGSAVLRHAPGTAMSAGTIPERKGPGAEFAEITGARPVHFMADYVFVRQLSPDETWDTWGL